MKYKWNDENSLSMETSRIMNIVGNLISDFHRLPEEEISVQLNRIQDKLYGLSARIIEEVEQL